MRFGFALVVLATIAAGETSPPGDYSDFGRVVRRANGQFDLFNGYGCLLQLPDKLAAQLKPHLGKMIRLDYTRVEYKSGELWDNAGSPIGKIRKITLLRPAPVEITVQTARETFELADPVTVTVTLRGMRAEKQGIDVLEVEVNLINDYRSDLSFRLRPSKRLGTRPLRPTEPIVLKLESERIATPGVYDVVAHFVTKADRLVISNKVRISIRLPKSLDDETAALRSWLPRAEPMERVRIAERLIERGDTRGVDVVIRLLTEQTKLYSHFSAYRFLWRHGGKRGEGLLLILLARQTRQDAAFRIMESVYRSARRLEHFHAWLADKRETARDFSGWCERPRICDITASWLCGYTEGAMKFPNGGSVEQRDRAVAAVITQIKKDPSRFEILTR